MIIITIETVILLQGRPLLIEARRTPDSALVEPLRSRLEMMWVHAALIASCEVGSASFRQGLLPRDFPNLIPRPQ
jgi:hypothetical protein